MPKAALALVLATVLLGGCATITAEPYEFRGMGRGTGGGTATSWASACPACGADIGGGSGFMGSYLYDNTQASRGPGQEW